METETSKTLQHDQDYLAEGFEVCGLFQRKRELLRELKKEKNAAKEAELLVLNVQIKEKDEAFWKQASESVAAGGKFAFEILAERYKLELYERRTLLFFFYLEFHHVSDNLCFEMDLLELLDFEASSFSRIRDFKYLRLNATLFQTHLLTREYVATDQSATCRIALHSTGLDVFSKLIDGEANVLSENKDDEKTISSKECDDVGRVVEAEYRLEDVVLTERARDKVMFFLSAFKEPAMEKLDISKTIKKGKGLNFLFYGPPGTGKSMLAEAIASYTGKKLLVVESPKIFNRWVGQTDKAIVKIFKAAKENDLVLCLDEADSLLYNRQYAVQEHEIRFVNIMLQEMERFDGIAVFTTNMDSLLDPAVERRISHRVEFSLPDEKMRSDIWKAHIPPAVKVTEDVDFNALARRFEFAGGYIKNAVLNALRKVALRKADTVSMEDLVWGGSMEKEGLYNKDQHKGPIGFATAQG